MFTVGSNAPDASFRKRRLIALAWLTLASGSGVAQWLLLPKISAPPAIAQFLFEIIFALLIATTILVLGFQRRVLAQRFDQGIVALLLAGLGLLLVYAVTDSIEYFIAHPLWFHILLEELPKLIGILVLLFAGKRWLERFQSQHRHAERQLDYSQQLLASVLESEQAMICRFQADTTLTFVNADYCRLFGRSEDELLGRRFVDLIPAIEHDAIMEKIAALNAQNPRQTYIHQSILGDGGLVWQKWTDQAIVDEHGEIVEYQSIGHDITAYQQAQATLAKNEQRLRIILDSMDDLIYVSDLKTDVIVFANTQTRAVFGDIEGQRCWEVLQSGRCAFCPSQAALLDAAGQPTGIRCWMQQNTLNAQWYNCRDQAIRWSDGRYVRLVMLTDITERKQMEEALRRSEQNYQTLFEHSMEAIGLHDVDGRILDVNQRACRLLGYTREECLGLTVFDTLPRDCSTVPPKDEILRQLREWIPGQRHILEVEHRRKDGTTYLAEVATGVIEYDGNRVILAFFKDITERKQMEDALRHSHDLLTQLSQQVPGALYQYQYFPDGRDRFPFVSDNFWHLHEIDPETMTEDTSVAFERIHPEDRERVMHSTVESYRTQTVWECDYRVILPKRGLRWLHGSSTPQSQRQEDGSMIWYGYFSDITERKQIEEALRRSEHTLKIKTEMLEKLSMQDGLTDIANRRYFDQRAEVEWKRVLRAALPLSFVLMDIDHFKQYNDHYGHGAGDECLRQVAQALAHCVERPLDLVARYGGEEFVALLPETEINGALHLAEQMRAAVEALAIPHAHSSAASVVTLSLGVATHAPDRVKTDLHHLQECADQALYRAKHQGRNQVQAERTLSTEYRQPSHHRDGSKC